MIWKNSQIDKEQVNIRERRYNGPVKYSRLEWLDAKYKMRLFNMSKEIQKEKSP